MYRILIVDNEENLRNAVVKYARFYGYEAVEAADGLEALRLCQTQNFDLILLDIMMPNMDGVTACREIRKLCDTPVIMLTARGDEYDRIVGFEAGADDYVIKPFSPKELMLRMAAILKRNDRLGLNDTVRAGGLTLSVVGRWLEVDGERVSLTNKEFDLLLYLMQHKGEAVSRQTLLEAFWDGDTESGRSLDTHIKQLRKALGKYSQYIVTLRGMGYRFEEA
ncbi:MAG: response regulator transcription factor [Oscillospiraceae bacterium]|jgi:two-component system response regulator ResD